MARRCECLRVVASYIYILDVHVQMTNNGFITHGSIRESIFVMRKNDTGNDDNHFLFITMWFSLVQGK